MRRLYTTLLAAAFTVATALGCAQDESELEQVVVEQTEKQELSPREKAFMPSQKVNLSAEDGPEAKCVIKYRSCTGYKDQVFWSECVPYQRGCWKSKSFNIRSDCMPQLEYCLDDTEVPEGMKKAILNSAKIALEQNEKLLIKVDAALPENYRGGKEESKETGGGEPTINKSGQVCPVGYECLKPCPEKYFRPICVPEDRTGGHERGL